MICDALWLYITANNKNDTYLNTNIYKPRTLLAGGDCKSRAAAAGGRGARAGSVARRPHERGRPRRGANTMKSEEQSRGQAKGFFHRQGGAFDSTFYVQGTNLVRRVALDYFSTSACRTRSTYLIHSTGPADQLLYVRAPAGR